MRLGSGLGCSFAGSVPFFGRPRLLGRASTARRVSPTAGGGGEGGGGEGGGGSSPGCFFVGFSRASIWVASRAITPTIRPRNERSISAACILSGRSPVANSAKARENVASEGTCERSPHATIYS